MSEKAKKKPVEKKPEKKVEYIVTRPFFDKVNKTTYAAGELYTETSKARTKALLEGTKNENNTLGTKFIQEK